MESLGGQCHGREKHRSKIWESDYRHIRRIEGFGRFWKNEEINEKVAELLSLSDEVLEISHLNSSLSEVNYSLAWARTLLKKASLLRPVHFLRRLGSEK